MNIITINLLYVFGNFPLLFLVLGISGFFSHASTAPTNALFPILNGIKTAGGDTSLLSALFGIAGGTGEIYAPTTWTYIFYGIGALFVVTFGLVNVGCTYLIRETVRGEHIFVFDDFISAIKKNFRQGIILGIFDFLMLAACIYADWSYLVNYSNYSILFFCSIAMTIMYLFLRTYIYIMLVTFDLKIIQILKNAFIFALLNFGRNLLALISCAVLVIIALFSTTIFMPIGIIFAIILLFSTMSYITMYLQYPKVEKLMIEPYYKDNPEESEEYDGEATRFLRRRLKLKYKTKTGTLFNAEYRMYNYRDARL